MTTNNKYDVIIIGAGPAGIFAALELTKKNGLKILMLERGKELRRRICPMRIKDINCIYCEPCALLSGWGGAGAFSDGKLTLSSRVGGHLDDYLSLPELEDLVDYVDQIYLDFGAPKKVYGVGPKVTELEDRAARAGLHLIPFKIRHLGTDQCGTILKTMYEQLAQRIEIRLRAEAQNLVTKKGQVKGVTLKDGTFLEAEFVIAAPGREGTNWLTSQAKLLDLKLDKNPVDIGVRVEVPATVLEELTSTLYESKLEFYTKIFDDRVRTFCMCPYGEVTIEYLNGTNPVITVNGHSLSAKRSPNTNFALLVSTTFTEPFKEPTAYGQYIAHLANLLGGGVIIQRLGDLLEGRRSTPERIARSLVNPTLKSATPGDLSFVLPYRHLTDLVEMLEAMDQIAPGIYSHHTLLYGVEVKFYSSRIKLSQALETEVGNLFAAGDGAGVTRGLVQASASGVYIARQILKRAIISPSNHNLTKSAKIK